MQVQQISCGGKGQRLQGSSKVGEKFDGCRGNGWSDFCRVGRLSFVLYKSGVYDEPNCSSGQVDHSLVVVGYGSIDGKKYWIAKNR